MHPILNGLVLEAVVGVPEVERWLGLLPHKTLRHLSGATLGNSGATVCEDQRPRHKTRLIRGGEGEDIGDLLRRGTSTENRAREGLLLHLGVHRTGLLMGPGGINRARTDAERAHAILALLVRHAAHEGMKKSF